MNHRKKQSEAATQYREAKKEAHRKAKLAARIEYDRVYNELLGTLRVEYMTGIAQKADTVDSLLASMEMDDEEPVSM